MEIVYAFVIPILAISLSFYVRVFSRGSERWIASKMTEFD